MDENAALPAPPLSNRFRQGLGRFRRRVCGSISGLNGMTMGTKTEEVDESVTTDGYELEERGRWRNDERRNTQFSVAKDGDDAGPAILYRSMHNIA